MPPLKQNDLKILKIITQYGIPQNYYPRLRQSLRKQIRELMLRGHVLELNLLVARHTLPNKVISNIDMLSPAMVGPAYH